MDLQEKVVEAEGIPMLENAPDVSCHFKGQTSCHGSGESPHAEEKGLDELSDEEDAK
jgi:hypothetical protein